MSSFLPKIKRAELEANKGAGKEDALYDLFAQPLHEELYKRQDFDFLDELSEGQELMLSYDYVRMQVMQGGFIQLIENGYVGLLMDMPEWLNMIGAKDMAKLIDDALKVYVLNKEMLEKSNTPEEFAKLYDELKEFEILDENFTHLNDDTNRKILQYAIDNIDEFAIVV